MACLSASLRNGASSTRSTVTGHLNGFAQLALLRTTHDASERRTYDGR